MAPLPFSLGYSSPQHRRSPRIPAPHARESATPRSAAVRARQTVSGWRSGRFRTDGSLNLFRPPVHVLGTLTVSARMKRFTVDHGMRRESQEQRLARGPVRLKRAVGTDGGEPGGESASGAPAGGGAATTGGAPAGGSEGLRTAGSSRTAISDTGPPGGPRLPWGLLTGLGGGAGRRCSPS